MEASEAKLAISANVDEKNSSREKMEAILNAERITKGRKVVVSYIQTVVGLGISDINRIMILMNPP